MQELWKALNKVWDENTVLLIKILATIAILFLAAFLRMLVVRVMHRRYHDDPRQQFIWRKNTSYFFSALGLLLIGLVWITNLQALSTYLGLVSAALVFAMQDLVANLAGWVFLIWRRPFQVGHRIQVNGVRGDVIDLRLFQFTLLELGNWVDADQSTGRIVHLPNSWVMRYEVYNYEAEFDYIWNEIPVLLTFESDWEKAKSILEAILAEKAPKPDPAIVSKVQAASERYLIHFRVLTPIVYTSTQDSGVLLTLRYLVPCRQRRGSTGEIWEAILRAFAEHKDIDFAYPTVRRYDERFEGKRGPPPDVVGTPGTPGPAAPYQVSLEPMTAAEKTVTDTTKIANS